jgi:hypothetical protein
MCFRHRIHAANGGDLGIAPEFGDRETRELWRELARPVGFFDERSPWKYSGNRIREFFRKWRALEDDLRTWAMA